MILLMIRKATILAFWSQGVIKLMRLINKEVLKGKGKFYLLSSCMVDCKFCYVSL